MSAIANAVRTRDIPKNRVCGKFDYVVQNLIGAAREVKRSHCLTLRGWKFKSFSDTGKYAAAGNTACVSLVNRCTQSSQLGLVFLFLAFQSPKRRADNLASIFIAPTFDFPEHKAVQFFRQINVARWHGPPRGYKVDSRTISNLCQWRSRTRKGVDRPKVHQSLGSSLPGANGNCL